jgi:hypothetical protein
MKSGASIVAKVLLKDGSPVRVAMVRAVKGKITATNAKAFNLQTAAFGTDTTIGVAFGGQPHKIQNLQPGEYSVCAVPFPDELRGMGPIMEYVDREGDNLPVFCKTATVTGTTDLSLTITVDAMPVYVPPPPDTAPPGGT